MESLTSLIEQRRTLLTAYFNQLAEQKNSALGAPGTCFSVIDPVHDHYMLIRNGWINGHYIHRVLLHIDINQETGQLWVMQNSTEILPDQDLAEHDLRPEDFVPGFRPAWIRQGNAA